MERGQQWSHGQGVYRPRAAAGGNLEPGARTSSWPGIVTDAVRAPLNDRYSGEAMSYEAEIDRVARDLQRMRVEYERFLAGVKDSRHEELKAQVVGRLKALRNSNIQSIAENFRLGTLEAQYNAYLELYGRRIREREEGPVAAPHLVERRPVYDPLAGVTVGPEPETGALEAIYRGLYSRAAKPADLDAFRGYLAAQIESIRDKTGCEQVQFRVAAENGKLKLKAKPIGASRAPA